jgi:hypothetical protein
MIITPTELENIERLLDSSDKANIELGLTILSGFAFDENGVNWLIEYYQKLEKEASKNQSRRNLQAILLGTITSEPTKASRVLTMLLEKTDLSIQKQILENLFINKNTLKLPRLELTDFPKAIFEFPDLEKITWQFGNLKTISADILRLSNLNYLDVRHQPLENIAENIVEHKNLKEMWIGNALIITENLAEAAKFEFFIEAAY